MSKSELTLPEISPEFKPNYDFVKTREMHITDWFRTFFVTFALYRAISFNSDGTVVTI